MEEALVSYEEVNVRDVDGGSGDQLDQTGFFDSDANPNNTTL